MQALAPHLAVVDWNRRFIFALRDLLMEDGGGDLSACTMVFPHRRPRRYLREVLAKDPAVSKPMFLPAMHSVTQWMSRLRRDLDERALRQAGLLDRAGLLFEVLESLGRTGGGPLARLPRARDRFFPWGVRLAELMEDLLRHDREPANLAHMAGEVSDTAAALLERLGDIFAAYLEALAARGWTTPGLDARQAARRAEEAADLLAGQRIILAGFHALTGAEEALFHTLWRHGAEVVLHTDPALARGEAGHWACAEHRGWLRRWKARARLLGPESTDLPRRIRFVEGFDLHSQLAALARLLGPGPYADTAVVVPDTSALMPVLHHLPDRDVNISMGYPLARTSLYRLLDTIIRLQEGAVGEPGSGQRRYYWRDLSALLRHPYLKMLEYAPGLPLRPALRTLEETMRQGAKFQRPDPADPTSAAFLADAAFSGGQAEAGRSFLAGLLGACLDRFEAAACLRDLGDALLGLAGLLLPPEPEKDDEAGPLPADSIWQRFPLDGECLHRLLRSVIPALRQSAVSAEPYLPEVLFTILRGLLERERVPFEAEPLAGLQVMGMLESRLLRFEHLYVLGAVDEVLPGGGGHDPLLPDPLRRALGLPDQAQRAQVAAYNFYSLLQGPGEAVICFQSGTQGSGPGARKAVRSRFVEQLLWEEEQRQGRILRAGQDPVAAVSFPVRPLPGQTWAPAASEPVRARLERLLAGPLSATAMDEYLACPARFFHRYLTPLREVAEVAEEGDPAGLGTVVHEVLHDFFAPLLGQETAPANMDPGPLMDEYSRRLRQAEFYFQMPYDRRLTLERSGRERLQRFLAAQPRTQVLGLERRLVHEVDLGGRAQALMGVVDRVDQRAGGLVVLDYKTGSASGPDPAFWDDQDLWARIRAWRPLAPDAPDAPDQDPDLAADVAKGLRSIQLPLYMLLHGLATGERPRDAAWVMLRDNGQEAPLFGPKADKDLIARAVEEQTPRLVRLVVEQMRSAKSFAPRPGPRCRWCPFKAFCPPA